MNNKTIKKGIKLYCNLAGISYKLRLGRVCMTVANYNKVCAAFIASYGLLHLVKSEFHKYILPIKFLKNNNN